MLTLGPGLSLSCVVARSGWVIEKVTRQRPDDFMRANIFRPLKMVDTDFFVPQEKFGR